MDNIQWFNILFNGNFFRGRLLTWTISDSGRRSGQCGSGEDGDKATWQPKLARHR